MTKYQKMYTIRYSDEKIKRRSPVMTAYKDLSKEELLELKSELEARFEEVKEKGLKLDMSRGKPAALINGYDESACRGCESHLRRRSRLPKLRKP